MYSIVLTNGKIINIKADDVCWEEKTKMARFLRDRNMVARINMDNVAGWIEANYKAENIERADICNYLTEIINKYNAESGE